MSNQVYLNPQTKLYDFPSLNLYNKISDQLVVTGSIPSLISFPQSTLIGKPDIFLWNPQMTAAAFLEAGMYSIQVNIGYTSTTDTETFLKLYINVNRQNIFSNLHLGTQRQDSPPDLSQIRYLSTSIVMYMAIGDIITFEVVNTSPNSVNILASEASLVVSKLL